MERLENISIGPRYAMRLENLGRWDRLQVSCFQCRNRAVIDPAELRRRWPGYTHIIDLERKLRCTACGNRDDNAIKIGRLKRG